MKQPNKVLKSEKGKHIQKASNFSQLFRTFKIFKTKIKALNMGYVMGTSFFCKTSLLIRNILECQQ